MAFLWNVVIIIRDEQVIRQRAIDQTKALKMVEQVEIKIKKSKH